MTDTTNTRDEPLELDKETLKDLDVGKEDVQGGGVYTTHGMETSKEASTPCTSCSACR